jgi:hypothetical protein
MELPKPYPDKENKFLQALVDAAEDAYNEGQVDLRGALYNAAVTAWYEGHIEGEDHCQGCDYRGDNPKEAKELRDQFYSS